MPKARKLLNCCLMNNVRYMILVLLIACCSSLFANTFLYSVAVLNDNFRDTQSWRKAQLTQLSLVKKRSVIDDEAFNSSILLSHLTEVLNGINFNETAVVHQKGNQSSFTYSSESFVTSVNDEETTTIRLLSEMGDRSESVSNEDRNKGLTTYKGGFSSIKDDEEKLSKWDDISKDDNEKPKQQVKIEGVSHKNIYDRIQHFLVWTAPGIGMLSGAFPAYWLLRSFGGRRFFAVALLISAIATALLAMIPLNELGRYTTACLRFIQGLTLASVFPMIGLVTANWGTLKQQFMFLICCTSSVQFAPAISWPASSAILVQNYQIPFLLHAAITCLLALIWMLLFREKPQYHFLVNGLELNKIVAGKMKAEHSGILAEHPFRLLTTSFSVWAIWIAALGYFFVLSLAVQFLPLYCLLIIHDTPADSALFSAVPFVFMLFVILLSGLWHQLANLCSDRVSILAFNTTSFIICSLIFIFLAIFPPGNTFRFSIVTPFTLILCALTFSIYGFYRSAILVGRFFAQFIVSYIQFFIGFAFFITAALAVLLIDENTAKEWRVIFLLLAALLMIFAAVFGVFGSAAPEAWSKDSWDTSATRPMITFDQIDYHTDECGVLEMRILR